MACVLTCIGGDAVPARIVVDGPLEIGRDPACDIRLLDDRSSRFHARVEPHRKGLQLRDLNSSNGTWFGDQQIEAMVVSEGQVFSCGGVSFSVSQPGSPGDTRVVTDIGTQLDVTAARAPRRWQAGDEPARLPLVQQCTQALLDAPPRQRARALAEALCAACGCEQAAVVLNGRAIGANMAPRLALRLAGGMDARILTLGADLHGQTVATAAIGSAASAPLGRAGHIVLARGLDQEAFTERDLATIAAIAAACATNFTVSAEADADGLVGTSTVMQSLRQRITRIAAADSSVLISGESGTGKELVARALHRQSGRNSGPFIAVNCAAVSEQLFEAELFGHARGAFTGAETARPGHFRHADGGVLFLDEIGEMPLALQAKLLRVLQEGEVQPVGESRTVAVDVRVIAATNRDLQADVSAGSFREDLFHRLDVIRIHTPALAQRLDDIPVLAEHLLSEAIRDNALPPTRLSADALAQLAAHSWSGNVRELANVITRAAIMCDGTITADALDLRPAAAAPTAEPGHFLTLAEMEARHVLAALEQCGWNKSAAARLLGVSRPTILKKISDYGLKPA